MSAAVSPGDGAIREERTILWVGSFYSQCAACTLGSGERISDDGDMVVRADGTAELVMDRAQRKIGGSVWSSRGWLFNGSNSAKQVRAIAESIAGERL